MFGPAESRAFLLRPPPPFSDRRVSTHDSAQTGDAILFGLRIVLISVLMFAGSSAAAKGFFAPEEKSAGGASHVDTSLFGHRHGPQCNVGMTYSGRGSGGHAMNRLQNDLIRAAEASGHRAPATKDSAYDANMSTAISYLMKNRLSKARGKCAIYVRRGLAHAGLTPNIPMGHAKEYVANLKKYCFQNMIGKYPTPESAPAGAVLVYKGINTRADKNAKYGHVEVRTPIGYVSDYFSDNPRTGKGSVGRNRQLIGVMIKPGGGSYRNCRK